MKSTIEGVDAVISGLESVGVDVREAAYYAIVEALQKAFEACHALLSETDHSLRDLALMGHPYSAAHPQAIHDPDVIVHMQDGTVQKLETSDNRFTSGIRTEHMLTHYRDSLRAVPPVGTGEAIIEGKIVNDSPLDRWIQEGTSKMRERPWMQYVVDTFGSDLADLIEARIVAAIERAA